MISDQYNIDNSSISSDNAGMAVQMSEQIRRLILASGMSRNQICIVIDLDPAIMSKFINYKGGLAMETLDRLGELLKLKVTMGAKRPNKRNGG